VYGFGDYSDIALIRASSVPDTMSMVNTIIVGTDILINWQPPADGGDGISAYEVEIYVPQSDSYVVEPTYCDNLDETTLQCVVPHSHLIDVYDFAVDDLVKARVRAYNINGWSDQSQLNTDGAKVQSSPG
jgi:hypothetical protein